MNYCNFAKVIIARNSKDPQSIDLWNSSSGKNNNSSPQLAVHLGKFNNLYTASERYEFYSRVMFKYPKMHVPYTTFVRQLPRLQNYLTKNSYWKNANKNGEKSQFLNHFDLKKWCTLSEKDKKNTPIGKLRVMRVTVSKRNSSPQVCKCAGFKYHFKNSRTIH